MLDMDPNEPNNYTIHRTSSGVHPRRSTSVVPTPRLAHQHRRLADSCIRPTPTELTEDVEGDDDIPEPTNSILPPLKRTLPGIHAEIPYLLGLDLSQHPSVFFHANEVWIIVVGFCGYIF